MVGRLVTVGVYGFTADGFLAALKCADVGSEPNLRHPLVDPARVAGAHLRISPRVDACVRGAQ